MLLGDTTNFLIQRFFNHDILTPTALCVNRCPIISHLTEGSHETEKISERYISFVLAYIYFTCSGLFHIFQLSNVELPCEIFISYIAMWFLRNNVNKLFYHYCCIINVNSIRSNRPFRNRKPYNDDVPNFLYRMR